MTRSEILYANLDGSVSGFYNLFFFVIFFFILSKLYGLIDSSQVNNLSLNFFSLFKDAYVTLASFFMIEEKFRLVSNIA